MVLIRRCQSPQRVPVDLGPLPKAPTKDTSKLDLKPMEGVGLDHVSFLICVLLDLCVSLTCHHGARCIMGRRWQCCALNKFCWETFVCATHVDVPLTRKTYLNVERVFCDSLFNKMKLPDVAEMPREWFEEHSQTLVQPSICGMFWTYQSDQWRLHLTTSKDCF